jgi:hypothetical protein
VIDPGQLRIGNADRRAVVGLLVQAAADGRLTPTEAAQRADAVESALTYSDLDALVADLPVVPPTQALAGQRQGQPPARPGWDPRLPVVIAGGASSEKRTGVWEVPPYLRVSGDLGSVRLDFREAVCLAPVVDIDVSGGAGSVRLIVPEGWGVDSDGVSKGWGSVRNRAERTARPGLPQLVLHGSAGIGSVSVKVVVPRHRRASRQALPPGSGAPSAWAREHPDMPNADDLR